MQDDTIYYADKDLSELIPAYLSNRVTDVRALEALLDEKDFDSIRRLGHRLKGTGGGYGFNAIAEIGCRLESAGSAGDETAVRNCLEELRDFITRVKIVYE